jgi:hypothetical protein
VLAPADAPALGAEVDERVADGAGGGPEDGHVVEGLDGAAQPARGDDGAVRGGVLPGGEHGLPGHGGGHEGGVRVDGALAEAAVLGERGPDGGDGQVLPVGAGAVPAADRVEAHAERVAELPAGLDGRPVVDADGLQPGGGEEDVRRPGRRVGGRLSGARGGGRAGAHPTGGAGPGEDGGAAAGGARAGGGDGLGLLPGVRALGALTLGALTLGVLPLGAFALGATLLLGGRPAEALEGVGGALLPLLLLGGDRVEAALGDLPGVAQGVDAVDGLGGDGRRVDLLGLVEGGVDDGAELLLVEPAEVLLDLRAGDRLGALGGVEERERRLGVGDEREQLTGRAEPGAGPGAARAGAAGDVHGCPSSGIVDRTDGSFVAASEPPGALWAGGGEAGH